ncbi:hypothetical protein ABIB00_002150 [Bradyrhizobium sp. LB14.3]|uniref:hypothetical protein n=1 Tax=Bradyrhizobium sp. LB14.3 TaxID=3156328 RepID=UPI0033954376
MLNPFDETASRLRRDFTEAELMGLDEPARDALTALLEAGLACEAAEAEEIEAERELRRLLNVWDEKLIAAQDAQPQTDHAAELRKVIAAQSMAS